MGIVYKQRLKPSYITCVFVITFILLIENLKNLFVYIIYVVFRYFVVFYRILIANGNSRKLNFLLIIKIIHFMKNKYRKQSQLASVIQPLGLTLHAKPTCE